MVRTWTCRRPMPRYYLSLSLSLSLSLYYYFREHFIVQRTAQRTVQRTAQRNGSGGLFGGWHRAVCCAGAAFWAGTIRVRGLAPRFVPVLCVRFGLTEHPFDCRFLTIEC